MKTLIDVKNSVMTVMLFTLLSCISFTQENQTPTLVKNFDIKPIGTADEDLKAILG